MTSAEIRRDSLRRVILSSIKRRLQLEGEMGFGEIMGAKGLIPSISEVIDFSALSRPSRKSSEKPDVKKAVRVEKIPLESLMSNLRDIPFATPPMSTEEKAAALEDLRAQLVDCRRCGVNPERLNMVFGEGDPDAYFMFIGEAPGRDEDEQGRPFVGRSGQLLTDIIEKGMKIPRSSVYIANVLKCRPPENRAPEPHEAAVCGPFLERQIEIIRPKAICLLGTIAARYLLILHYSSSLGANRGRVHDYRGIPVVVTYHPSYLLRNPSSKKECWKDIQLLMSLKK
ncbi:MAG: hypothetical protein Kow00107_01430 [Planctomycetota bacterium]